MGRRKNKISPQVLQASKNDVDSFEYHYNLFVRDCRIRNLSEHTFRYYKNELMKFCKRLERNQIDTSPAVITEEIIKDYVVLGMMNEGKKEATINANLRAIRAFFNFLEKEGFIIENPVKDVKLVKEKRTIIQTFSRDQIHALLRQPDRNTFTGIRDYTLMMFLLETGVRVREICDILTTDINFIDGVVRIDGKGNKERFVPIQKTMKKQLSIYLQVRGELDTNILFVNIDNEPLAIRAIQTNIARYGRMAGIKNVRCSPHTFRHTFAKMSVQNGADVFSLQSVLGHTSMEMVRNYVNMFSNEVRDNHSKFSPIEKLF
ncbi:tyrosine-type recombinase/integrase [Neobacillus thermocopriae]|jgi:integrase/recombinase XerD|uniref:tyrosine-type recombinase/integrase n=1 Tax=Neobacillus thermocopriae TaxID=1215031 RepID=UPI002E22D211|nr:tyrosine-type recombinase/integrase [Neobacillus thermocopriae]MED3624669.1 tyrosine-type recombinase/integrase [Neobacillus thermocopriae]MED3715547.1 tyrosine-type recombinase/integrase [Neobacillus thermocopriae]